MKPSILMSAAPVAAAILLLSSMFLVGCKGPEGPVGPEGPQGPPGPGSRKVYSGTLTSAARSSTGQFVSVPELNLADFPLVGVYVMDNTGDWAQLNLVVYNPSTGTYSLFEVAVLRTGSVTIFSQVGQSYRIVVVY